MNKGWVLEIIIWAIAGIYVIANPCSTILGLKIQYGLLWMAFLLTLIARFLGKDED